MALGILYKDPHIPYNPISYLLKGDYRGWKFRVQGLGCVTCSRPQAGWLLGSYVSHRLNSLGG